MKEFAPNNKPLKLIMPIAIMLLNISFTFHIPILPSPWKRAEVFTM